MDFLDFVTAKPEVLKFLYSRFFIQINFQKTESVEEHIEAPMIVEPVHAENEVRQLITSKNACKSR